MSFCDEGPPRPEGRFVSRAAEVEQWSTVAGPKKNNEYFGGPTAPRRFVAAAIPRAPMPRATMEDVPESSKWEFVKHKMYKKSLDLDQPHSIASPASNEVEWEITPPELTLLKTTELIKRVEKLSNADGVTLQVMQQACLAFVPDIEWSSNFRKHTKYGLAGVLFTHLNLRSNALAVLPQIDEMLKQRSHTPFKDMIRYKTETFQTQKDSKTYYGTMGVDGDEQDYLLKEFELYPRAQQHIDTVVRFVNGQTAHGEHTNVDLLRNLVNFFESIFPAYCLFMTTQLAGKINDLDKQITNQFEDSSENSCYRTQTNKIMAFLEIPTQAETPIDTGEKMSHILANQMLLQWNELMTVNCKCVRNIRNGVDGDNVATPTAMCPEGIEDQVHQYRFIAPPSYWLELLMCNIDEMFIKHRTLAKARTERGTSSSAPILDANGVLINFFDLMPVLGVGDMEKMKTEGESDGMTDEEKVEHDLRTAKEMSNLIKSKIALNDALQNTPFESEEEAGVVLHLTKTLIEGMEKQTGDELSRSSEVRQMTKTVEDSYYECLKKDARLKKDNFLKGIGKTISSIISGAWGILKWAAKWALNGVQYVGKAIAKVIHSHPKILSQFLILAKVLRGFLMNRIGKKWEKDGVFQVMETSLILSQGIPRLEFDETPDRIRIDETPDGGDDEIDGNHLRLKLLDKLGRHELAFGLNVNDSLQNRPLTQMVATYVVDTKTASPKHTKGYHEQLALRLNDMFPKGDAAKMGSLVKNVLISEAGRKVDNPYLKLGLAALAAYDAVAAGSDSSALAGEIRGFLDYLKGGETFIDSSEEDMTKMKGLRRKEDPPENLGRKFGPGFGSGEETDGGYLGRWIKYLADSSVVKSIISKLTGLFSEVCRSVGMALEFFGEKITKVVTGIAKVASFGGSLAMTLLSPETIADCVQHSLGDCLELLTGIGKWANSYRILVSLLNPWTYIEKMNMARYKYPHLYFYTNARRITGNLNLRFGSTRELDELIKYQGVEASEALHDELTKLKLKGDEEWKTLQLLGITSPLEEAKKTGQLKNNLNVPWKDGNGWFYQKQTPEDKLRVGKILYENELYQMKEFARNSLSSEQIKALEKEYERLIKQFEDYHTRLKLTQLEGKSNNPFSSVFFLFSKSDDQKDSSGIEQIELTPQEAKNNQEVKRALHHVEVYGESPWGNGKSVPLDESAQLTAQERYDRITDAERLAAFKNSPFGSNKEPMADDDWDTVEKRPDLPYRYDPDRGWYD